MDERERGRIRGSMFLLTGIVTAGLGAYLLFVPEVLDRLHPMPLLVLLIVTILISFHRAFELLH
ncbi:hypothetical protein [Haloarchaeobius sp. TZWWS8]|uniref:hypothetical protein n=1 Tax=Haloarchaeobius sp. TZWWS8 TaxID=3446121 RepID=UPI003EC14424